MRNLRAVLNDNGITVRGEAIDIDALVDEGNIQAPRQLLVHHSPPLTETGSVLMMVSQNLYAETFFRTLGSQEGKRTAEAGRNAVRTVMTSWGISPDSYQQYDGSGLSRYNYVTADMLITLLTRMHEDPKHTDAFKATLPIAGLSGSLERRMKGGFAEKNARAKTGSISKSECSIEPSNIDVIIDLVFWILIRFAPEEAEPPIQPVFTRYTLD